MITNTSPQFVAAQPEHMRRCAFCSFYSPRATRRIVSYMRESTMHDMHSCLHAARTSLLWIPHLVVDLFTIDGPNRQFFVKNSGSLCPALPRHQDISTNWPPRTVERRVRLMRQADSTQRGAHHTRRQIHCLLGCWRTCCRHIKCIKNADPSF